MKKLLMFALVAIITISAQAQEKEIKNTYIQKGDVVEATLHYDNGVVSQTGFFTKDGKLTGEWISFDRNGTKTAEAQYQNGKKVGTWFFWNDDKLTEVSYSNSRVAAVNVWKNEGERVVVNR